MISVVIPTYNEEQNIGGLIEEIKSCLSDRQNEILVVDDNSEDLTQQRVREKKESFDNIGLIARDKRHGIGSAYKAGFREAAGDIVAQSDADFSHPPRHLPDLVSRIEAGRDVAVGSRYVKNGTRNDPLHRRINPLIGSYLYRYLIGSPVRDVTSGFKAYDRSAVESILERSHELPDGFHFQAASLMHLVEKGHSVEEVAIDFMPRRAGDPKYDVGDLVDNIKLLLSLGADRHIR